MTEAGLLGGVLGGVPLLASFENVAKIEAACGMAPDAVRRLGALGVLVKEDAERLAQRLRLANAETERLIALEAWWRVGAGGRRAGGARAPLSPRAAIVRRPRAGRLGALAGGNRRCGLARACKPAATLDVPRLPAQGRGFLSAAE